MLGSAMMKALSNAQGMDVVGSIRSDAIRRHFSAPLSDRLFILQDVLREQQLVQAFDEIRPDAVINCISPSRAALTKQDPLQIIPICALLPHRLDRLCGEKGARLVHIGTDGVFSGSRGSYREDDVPDAVDVYGVSKHLGEPKSAHSITIRTSIIGHELRTSDGLLGWFLAQDKHCNCFSRAVFSGLPSVVLAQIIRDVVLPRPALTGVYHVAAEPITKCDLLRLIAKVYGKSIEIVPNDAVVVDRSLNAERFREATGYVAPDWPTLIQTMHSSR